MDDQNPSRGDLIAKILRQTIEIDNAWDKVAKLNEQIDKLKSELAQEKARPHTNMAGWSEEFGGGWT
jgi:hypothetical protein